MNQRTLRSGLIFVVGILVSINFFGCASMGVRSIPLEELKAKYSVSDSDFINIDGINIHYRDEGTGPALVLIHGICASLYTWDGWAKELKDDYRIIRMDIPGWGFTGAVGKDSYNLEKMLNIMEGFLNEIGVESFYLAGNSLGGYYAWNYAVKHPEQVKKMVLLDPVCYPQSTPWFIDVANIPLIRTVPKVILPKYLVSMNVRAVYADDSRITEEVYDLYYDLSMRAGNRASYIDTFRFMATQSRKESTSEGVHRIKIPVLLMYGREDKWVPPEHAKLWKRDVPTSESLIYDNVGHVPMEELPVRTARDASAFLSRS